MSNELQIYRKRLIPEECILLKDDIIVEQNEDYILTKWKTLNPKTTFSHGCSCYYLKEGFKISKFYRHDGSLLYWYCDIVEYTSRPEDNSLIVTDLLADIILYPDGRMHVVDLDELAEALEKGADHPGSDECLPAPAEQPDHHYLPGQVRQAAESVG
ncbi:MAG: DUF402 domain-containing protein [Waltera sp.]